MEEFLFRSLVFNYQNKVCESGLGIYFEVCVGTFFQISFFGAELISCFLCFEGL